MFLFLFYTCIVFRIFSFILPPPRLKIPATYEAQQVPPEWSPKFLHADLLFCVTLPRNRIHCAYLCGNIFKLHCGNAHHVCDTDSLLLNAYWQEPIESLKIEPLQT